MGIGEHLGRVNFDSVQQASAPDFSNERAAVALQRCHSGPEIKITTNLKSCWEKNCSEQPKSVAHFVGPLHEPLVLNNLSTRYLVMQTTNKNKLDPQDTCRAAMAAAHPTGLPPNVLPCVPGVMHWQKRLMVANSGDNEVQAPA